MFARAGLNKDGQLGDGSTDNRVSPTNVTLAHNVHMATHLAVGLGHTCVVVNYGAAASLCWG